MFLLAKRLNDWRFKINQTRAKAFKTRLAAPYRRNCFDQIGQAVQSATPEISAPTPAPSSFAIAAKFSSLLTVTRGNGAKAFGISRALGPRPFHSLRFG
jgi:hypothetical protein